MEISNLSHSTLYQKKSEKSIGKTDKFYLIVYHPIPCFYKAENGAKMLTKLRQNGER
jgi:hypothetical protein